MMPRLAGARLRLAAVAVVSACTLLVNITAVWAANPHYSENQTKRFFYTKEVLYDPSSTCWQWGCDSAGTDNGNLVVYFDEGSLGKYATVDYTVDATVTPSWTCGPYSSYPPTVVDATPYPVHKELIGLAPAPKGGRVTATVPFEVEESSVPCATAGMTLWRIEYSSITVTNLTTGRSYDLLGISQNFPT